MSLETISRFEYKYPLHPSRIETLLAAVKPYCVLDSISLPEKNGWYTVDTLYWETPRNAVYWSCEDQHPVRTKLRVRTYPDIPGAVAKIELKRRIQDLITKDSTVVPGEGWQAWLDGRARGLPLPGNGRQTLEEFLTLERIWNARPRLLIRYQRLALRSRYDDYVRLTLDRTMLCQKMEAYNLAGHPRGWAAVEDGWTLGGAENLLLELKFKRRPPLWLAEIVRRMGLTRQGFSKYCCSLRRLYAAPARLGDLAPLERHGGTSGTAWIC